jgi:hypothetical protein
MLMRKKYANRLLFSSASLNIETFFEGCLNIHIFTLFFRDPPNELFHRESVLILKNIVDIFHGDNKPPKKQSMSHTTTCE